MLVVSFPLLFLMEGGKRGLSTGSSTCLFTDLSCSFRWTRFFFFNIYKPPYVLTSERPPKNLFEHLFV